MWLTRLLQALGALGLAAGITSGAVLWDGWRLQQRRTEESLKWARMTAAMVDRAFTEATAQGRQDPPRAAVEQTAAWLPEPLKLFPARVAQQEQRAEIHRFDLETGDFDYMRTIALAGGAGFRLRVASGYEGFLGARSRESSGALTGLLFTSCFLIAFMCLRLLATGWRPATVSEYVGRWSAEVNDHFKRFAVHLRDFIREAKALIERASEADGALRELGAGASQGADRARAARESLVCLRAEAAALESAITELAARAEKYGVAPLERACAQLQARSRAFRAAVDQSSRSVTGLDQELSGWSDSARSAAADFASVRVRGQELRERIGRVTILFAGAARQVKDIRSELAPDSAPDGDSPRRRSGAA
ncbi:MAG: hypothetical protein IT285_03595 [Bdellovibrionales bacterium]|nr:hypothetical protein [Bdellovibrionales bacterium]